MRAFDTRFGRVGMLICEDFWHMSAPYVLWVDGADLLIFGNSSPTRGVSASEAGRLTVARWVELINQAYGSTFTNYVVICNRVGYEDGKNFWGGSSIVNPEGEFLLHGQYFDETLITQDDRPESTASDAQPEPAAARRTSGAGTARTGAHLAGGSATIRG